MGNPSYVFAASSEANINILDTVEISAVSQTSSTYVGKSSKQTNKREAWVPPQREVKSGFWARLRGLGRRGSCSDLDLPLIAVVPTFSTEKTNDVDAIETIQIPSNNGELEAPDFAGQGITLTLSSNPNFWFYIPEQARDQEQGTKQVVELMIQDDEGEDILDAPIPARLETGLVSFQAPATLVNFEPNQPYHWYFSVVCAPERPSRNPNVDGWIERVDSTALGIDVTKLEQLSPEERLDLYSKFNIWNETVTLLAKERCLNPQDPTLVEYWNTLLDSSLPGVGRDWIDPLTYCIHPGPLTLTG